MAGTIGNHTISESNINVVIESDDGRTRLSGNGTAELSLSVDRGAVGIVNAIKFNPLTITFPAEIADDFTGIHKYAEIEQSAYIAGKILPLAVSTTTIDRVPGFPFDLATEYFDVNVIDEHGAGMVCTLVSDGSLTGDIDQAESNYNSATGALTVKWVRPLKQGQDVTVRKNFTMPPAPPVTVQLVGLVPYKTLNHYSLAAKVRDMRLNKHTPIAPKTLVIRTHDADGEEVRITDNGNGQLVANTGILDTATTNFVDYDSGEINFTFAQTMQTDAPITIEHLSLLPVREYRRGGMSSRGNIKVILSWEDLARMVKSIEQTASSVENGLKYRADT